MIVQVAQPRASPAAPVGPCHPLLEARSVLPAHSNVVWCEHCMYPSARLRAKHGQDAVRWFLGCDVRGAVLCGAITRAPTVCVYQRGLIPQEPAVTQVESHTRRRGSENRVAGGSECAVSQVPNAANAGCGRALRRCGGCGRLTRCSSPRAYLDRRRSNLWS